MSEARVCLISGANRGIGEAIARRLADDGWRLSLGMREPVGPRWAGDASGLHLHAYDASDPGAEAAWVEAAMETFGRIDAIVANAGVMIPKNVVEAEDADLDAMLEVNVKAPRRLAKAAWAPLKASGAGRIVVISSLSGKRVKSAASGLYAMTKFAALALVHGLRQAGWDDGIRATAICPGFVATDMARAITDHDETAMTQPEDIAELASLALNLPARASVAELHVNCLLESRY